MKISLNGQDYTWYRNSSGRRVFKGNSGKKLSYALIYVIFSLFSCFLLFSFLILGIICCSWSENAIKGPILRLEIKSKRLNELSSCC